MFKSKPSIVASAVLLSLGLSACGGSSDKKEPEVVNAAPSSVALSTIVIEENAVAAEVGTITVTDSDAGDTHTLTVNDERFEIVDGLLKLKAEQVVDFESEATVAVTVTATDAAGASKAQDFTLEVTDLLDTYKFASKFIDGESSVSYSGQIARQVLILELVNYISSGLQADIDSNTINNAAEAKTKLMRMYAATDLEWDEDADDTLTATTTPDATQTSLRAISGSYKNLQKKIAGKDATGQTKNWDTDFVGWNAKGSVTPDTLVQHFFDLLAANADKEANGIVRTDITGANITKLYLQDDGTDLKQLVQKFLLGAVNYSQGTDDYLDNDVDGKGLLSTNTDGGKAYSSLEHQFDEGFGYFGAARDYNDYSDDEIAKKDGRADWQGSHDTNGDEKIDFQSEYNFGHSQNAAKRDRNTSPATDFTKTAFDAFLAGRKIINDAAGNELTADEMTALLTQRDIAVQTWEKAIAATVVHYINDTIDDLELLGGAEYSSGDYADLAKHWSELKGFALSLQFNPHSLLSDADFALVQDKIGMAPVLTQGEVAAYKVELLAARDILKAAYSFDDANVTDTW